VGTSDFEVQTRDLAWKTIRALARGAPFPAGLATYAFDGPTNAADLAAMRMEAKLLQDGAWRARCTSRPRHGNVRGARVGIGVALRRRGLPPLRRSSPTGLAGQRGASPVHLRVRAGVGERQSSSGRACGRRWTTASRGGTVPGGLAPVVTSGQGVASLPVAAPGGCCRRRRCR